MKYIKLVTNNCYNGPGLRVVLWVSGCALHCKGCCNPESWDPDYGTPFINETFQKIMKALEDPYINGITLSGGDPLYQGNWDTIYDIVKEVSTQFNGSKTIWLYTGQKYEDLVKRIETRQILLYTDVLVDGPFQLNKRDHCPRFKGSRNQRLIDVKESLKKGKVILYE